MGINVDFSQNEAGITQTSNDTVL